MSTPEDPLGIVGKWFKPPDFWGLNDGLIEVINHNRQGSSTHHYYNCVRYTGNSVIETIYYFPWDAFEQLEM